MLARRRFLQFSAAAVASSLALPLLARAAGKATANAPTDAAITAASDFAALEKACAGRLGVTLLDTASGRRISHRQDERFPMCSTFKSMLAATVLSQAERMPALLDRRVPVGEADLLSHAPVTRRHAGKDMTVRDLCRAAEADGAGRARVPSAPRLRVTAKLARDSSFMAASHTVAGARL